MSKYEIDGVELLLCDADVPNCPFCAKAQEDSRKERNVQRANRSESVEIVSTQQRKDTKTRDTDVAEQEAVTDKRRQDQKGEENKDRRKRPKAELANRERNRGTTERQETVRQCKRSYVELVTEEKEARDKNRKDHEEKEEEDRRKRQKVELVNRERNTSHRTRTDRQEGKSTETDRTRKEGNRYRVVVESSAIYQPKQNMRKEGRTTKQEVISSYWIQELVNKEKCKTGNAESGAREWTKTGEKGTSLKTEEGQNRKGRNWKETVPYKL